MANLKISQLNPGNPAAVGDQLPINRAGTNFSVTAESVAALVPAPSASTLGGVESFTAPSNQFVTGVTTAGLLTAAQPSFSNISGQASLTAQVSGVLPVANGGNAVVATSGQGYFIPGGFPLTTTTSAQAIANAQQVRAIQFMLDNVWTISKITMTIVGISAASTVTLGIYSADGNTKLIDSGTFDGGTASVQTKTITPVTLLPGIYWFAQSSSTPTTLTAQTITPNANMLALVNNQTLKHVGIATNAATSGVLPSALGAITGSSINIVMAVFEP